MQKLPWTRKGKSSKQFQHEIWEKSGAKRRSFWKHKETKESPLCNIHGQKTSENAELEPKLQKCKGRIVLRGDIVKDDSGSYAVFTEQGSSACQMTAAKILDARLPDCDGQAADAVSAFTPRLLGIPESGCPDVWIRLPRQMARTNGKHWYFLNEIYMAIH